MYVLRLPATGSTLEHIAIPAERQAISWQRGGRRILWAVQRKTREAVAAAVPPIAD